MEKNSFQLILIVSLVLGLLFSQSTASFNEICAKECRNRCLSHGSQNVEACTKDCLKTCNSETSLETSTVKRTSYFFEIGCVYSM
ncbi:hypothetical protein Pint_29873 [Pistacia integerrima]|uniref:Uncharacterized protein n=1 Tax=Pistacia integerrima TaxID=434235 RepID=A0ACC0X0M5_9ROSI|nr:hypothetical protein Pint_29873 [Pistacia integerrima]